MMAEVKKSEPKIKKKTVHSLQTHEAYFHSMIKNLL